VGYEIRAMSLGEILDMGFRLLRNHFVLLVGLQCIVSVPPAMVGSYLGAGSGSVPDPSMVIASMLPLLLAFLILQPIVMAAITHAISECYLSGNVTFGGALRFALRIVLPLLGTWILASLMIVVGLVFFILPGLILLLLFALLTPVMVTEGAFGLTALERSWHLMNGNMLRALGLILVTAILSSALTAGVGMMAGFLPVIGGVLSGVAQAAANAFGTVTLVMLYFDIRCRKEAFDLEHLARQVESEAGAPPAEIA
jgi:hypothetical protein